MLPEGTGSFVFVDKAAHPDKPITVWYHRSIGTDEAVPAVFVMHGVKRNGEKYRDDWIELANAHKFLVAVLEFAKEHFRGGRRYNLGNMVRAAGPVR